MLVVLAITDYCLDGEVLRFKAQEPNKISAKLSGINNAESQLRVQKETEEESMEELGKLIASKSCEFVQAAFSGDKAKIADMLSGETEYIVSKDNSSYIRYATEDLHVEGYMATDRKLVQVRHSWYVIEDDGTITSGIEVAIEGEEASQIWYIHFRKSFGQWKIYMMENGI